jgi:hypothetical protein
VEKDTELWPVERLAETFSAINFPEYQREPNVWSREAKQRLIDSMVRQFDIASIYLYVDDEGSIDCIDGRQRIGAIMSFLDENPEDADNGFEYKILNEIFEDDEHPFDALYGRRFAELKAAAPDDPLAGQLVALFNNYRLTIVQLRGSRRPEEFNLQFTRLNLGTIINSGEKLNAMVGDLRDACFSEGGLGAHEFFEGTGIPTRRFAKEQTAAQALTQILSLHDTGEYTRTRHFDLQKFFKQYAVLTAEQRTVIGRTRTILDLLEAAFDELGVLHSRAITVSTVLLAWEENVSSAEQARQLAQFIDGFACRLRWQVKKGLDVDDEYRYLIDFQRHLTQASVEKPAVAARATVLRQEFARWREDGTYRGDEAFQDRSGTDPSEACQAVR